MNTSAVTKKPHSTCSVLGLATIALALAIGCAGDASTIENNGDCQDLPEPEYEPGSSSDEALAALVPGYAGAALLQGSAALQMFLTDAALGPLYEDEIRQHFAAMPIGWSGELSFTQVRYSYYQLMQWRAAFFHAGGWNGLEVDFQANAVVVGVDGDDAIAAIQHVAHCFMLPEDAVVIVVTVSGTD